MSTDLGHMSGSVGENPKVNNHRKLSQKEIADFTKKVRQLDPSLYSGKAGTIQAVEWTMVMSQNFRKVQERENGEKE